MSQAAIILFVSLVVFLILNVPVGIAIGLASLCVVFNSSRLSDSFMVQQLITGTDSFPIMAIPLFILAGELMAAGGVSKRILNVCSAYFGHITGGLAIVTVVVCMFFAAVSGSGPATVAAVGAMVVPAMLEKGYSKSFTLACIACSGCIGVIIPPSITFVVYGSIADTSIGDLFKAGIIPGLIMGAGLIVKRLAIIWDAKWALIDPIIILGGIYGGIFTPTEAAAVAAVYAFICGVFIYRELTPKQLFNTIASACSTNGTTMAIIGAATAFTRILTIEQIPAMITQAILNISSNPIIVLILINILLLIVGCFMDTTPAMMVLSPILLPVALSLGLSAIHFGIIMVVNLAIGFITPPLGINLFVAARVGNTSLETVCRGIIIFIIVMLFCLLCITYIPAISETLPKLAGMRV